MFSLKLDNLFPALAAAKELARKLNVRRNALITSANDPRELQRIRAEFNAARDRMQMLSVTHRNRIR